VRSIANSLPFKKYSPMLIEEMVCNIVYWLDSFPHNDGIHSTISPRTLIMGMAMYFNKHFKNGFRTYVQVHDKAITH